MNKRIKLKKGITHKSCDCRCENFRLILEKGLKTNKICERRNLKREDKIQDLLLINLMDKIGI